MENTVQNKKNSIDALARIVANMQQIYAIAQNIEQYCEEYAVFAGNEVINDMRAVRMQLKDTNRVLSNVAEQVEKKVDRVLAGELKYPEYRILTIDRRLISGETKKAYILKWPESADEQKTYFIPKSMTIPNVDSQSVNFKYYPDFSVVAMSNGKEEQGRSKVPVQFLVHMVDSLNSKIQNDEVKEELGRRAVRYYSTGERREYWPYEISPEEVHKDPEWGRAMDDLYLAGDEDILNIEALVYMRKYIDPEITVKEMKECSDFLYKGRFEDFESITTMVAEQDEFVKRLLVAVNGGKQDINEFIPEAERLFGPSHSQDLSREAAMIV